MLDIEQQTTIIAESLIGQCIKGLEEVIEENNFIDTLELRQSFDMKAFCCDGCGWWCSKEELNNDTSEQLCDDCLDDPEFEAGEEDAKDA